MERHGQRGRIQKGAEGVSRKARPAWAEELRFLAMPCHLLLYHLPPILCLLAQKGHPSPTSQFLPTPSPTLSPTRETDLPPRFLGLQVPSSSHSWGSCRCGCNPSGVSFLSIAICAFQNLLSSHSSGRCQDVLSLDWTRSSRSRQRRAKSETPD